ncbi:MAG: hypothetical protein ACYCXW_05570 [Solirubrobacteraceae bacterium]
MLTPVRASDSPTATLAIGAAGVVIVCCAGLPAIVAFLGGLTLGAILGLGLGAVLLGALTWTAVALFVGTRQRRRCAERSRHR